VPDKEIYVVPSVAGSACLDVPGSTLDDAELVQWDCHGEANLRWLLVDQGDGFFLIVSKVSGKCLDVTRAFTDDNVRVIQYSCAGDDNQRWQLVAVEDGVFEIRAKHSGKCLALKEGGSVIVQQACSGGAGQPWTLSPAP